MSARASQAGGGGWFEALAPAKVNLHLAVLGRRPDGYHEIDTHMLAVDLCDRVRARRSATPGMRLVASGPRTEDVPLDERNLAWRAAAEVLERSGASRSVGLELELEKHVPSAAGLGGASSDAAAALLASEAALGLELPPEERRALLAALGSDCVFFLETASTGFGRCTGRGERVESLGGPRPRWWVSLVTPDTRCPTKSVYAELRAPLCVGGSAPSFPESVASRSAAVVRGELFNALEEAAARAAPGLRAWEETLTRCGARHMRLSGSGSSFYGLHDERRAAETELAAILAALAHAGLVPRLATVVRPAGHGALLLPVRR